MIYFLTMLSAGIAHHSMKRMTDLYSLANGIMKALEDTSTLGSSAVWVPSRSCIVEPLCFQQIGKTSDGCQSCCWVLPQLLQSAFQLMGKWSFLQLLAVGIKFAYCIQCFQSCDHKPCAFMLV